MAGAAGLGVTITQTLIGVFAGLIAVAVVGAMFMTAEYRRGLIRVTLAATPGRGRVLAAKAVVIAAVTFAVGLVSSAIVVTVGQRMLRAHGVYVWPVTALTEARVIVGTAAVLAVAAVIALAIGTIAAAQRRRGRGRDRGDRAALPAHGDDAAAPGSARPTGWPGSPRPPRSPSSRP